MKVGVLVTGATPAQIVATIRAADEAGVHCAWMTSGGVSFDPLAIYAAAATQTERIHFGSAIVPTFPRHPLALVQSALVVDGLAPGRLRLGVGPSGAMAITPIYGMPFERPQEHLREYVTILREALSTGGVDFQGKRLSAKAQGVAANGVSVYSAALRASAFELAGEVSDGAISWVCPPAYLREVALPALKAGAEAAGRATPALIGHILVAPTTDREAARAGVRRTLGFFPRIKTYQDMFADAGFSEARETGQWSDAMCDAITISGSDAEIRDGLAALEGFGFDEAMAGLLTSPGDEAALAQGLELLGSANS